LFLHQFKFKIIDVQCTITIYQTKVMRGCS
jgi:hypothetical protein